jgi:hypothetical protein
MIQSKWHRFALLPDNRHDASVGLIFLNAHSLRPTFFNMDFAA